MAIAVAGTGAAVVRRRFGTGLQRLDKGAGDFATDADVEAERAMLGVLQRERPDDAVLGEETGRSGPAAGSRTWLPGCTVTDLRGQAWGRGATGLIAAADAETHAALLALVRKSPA